MSHLLRPYCWLTGHWWKWLVRGRVQQCEMCDAIRRT